MVVAEIDKAEGRARRVRDPRARAAEALFVGGGRLLADLDAGAGRARASQAFGGIDLLVNNAAIFGDMKLASLMDVDWDYYQRFMNVNMNGVLLCTRACAPAMKKRGGGAIVNQSSTAAWMGVGYYGLAKLAVNGLTQCLARELGHAKIRVNAIAPGPTDTEALRAQVPEAYKKQLVASLALPRLGTPGRPGADLPLPALGRRRVDDGPGRQRRRRPDHAALSADARARRLRPLPGPRRLPERGAGRLRRRRDASTASIVLAEEPPESEREAVKRAVKYCPTFASEARPPASRRRRSEVPCRATRSPRRPTAGTACASPAELAGRAR